MNPEWLLSRRVATRYPDLAGWLAAIVLLSRTAALRATPKSRRRSILMDACAQPAVLPASCRRDILVDQAAIRGEEIDADYCDSSAAIFDGYHTDDGWTCPDCGALYPTGAGRTLAEGPDFHSCF